MFFPCSKVCDRDRTVRFSFNDGNSYEKNIQKEVRPRIVSYRSFKHFSNETFKIYLENNLPKEIYVNNDDGLEKFSKTNMDTLNKIATIKNKQASGNQIPFMN